ncbi:tape measure protein [Paenibacillus dokdonensis]|uniref:tape measure protein n=1 Tax=Paenibacillus dokdonensis TaxID=2567944 RepID=UPI0010A8662D|nr:tape measure protein [Paenibacillus dokdonensis]
MADNKEFYRLDLVIGTDGVEETEKTVKAMDKLLEQTQRRAAALGKTKITPSVSLQDKATSSANKVTTTMNKVDRIVAKPEARLVNRVSSATNKISSTLTGLTRKTWHITVGVKNLALGVLSGIKNTLFSLPSMLAAGGTAYGGVVAPLNLSGQMEQANIAFETMLGSAAKAKSLLTDLQDFANRTPFEFPELRDSSKRLLAFGFEAKQIIPMMTAIGNASSGLGLGGEGIDRITIALGQMKAKQKVSAEEMMQLTEAGIPAWDILASKMKISTAEVMKLSSKGVIPAKQTIDALIEGMNKRFPNMMDKQSKSLLGIFSNMKDVFSTKLLMRWGDGIRLAIQPRLLKLSEWLDKNETTIQRWGDSLQRTASKATTWVMDKFENVYNTIRNLSEDPVFQNADFFGKVKIAWDKIIAEPLGKWLETEGAAKLENFASKIGDILGGGAHGLIMGGLEVLSPSSEQVVDKNPYVQAGRQAGKAFFDSFIEAFDAPAILNKLLETFKNIQPEALGGNTSSTGGSIASLALDAWLLSKGFKVLKKGKDVLDTGKNLLGGKTAPQPGTTVATDVATNYGTKAAETSLKGDQAKYDPRYRTPTKGMNPPKEWIAPGIPTLGKLLGIGTKVSTVALGAAGLAGVGYNIISGGSAWENAASDKNSIYSSVMAGRGGSPGMTPDLQNKIKNDILSQFSNKNNSTTINKDIVKISPEQVDSIVSSIQTKQEVKNEINVTVTPGAVQLNMPTQSIDYDEVANKVGSTVANKIRSSFQNTIAKD